MKREVRTVRSRLVILAVLMCTSILFVVGFGGIALAAEPVTIRLQTWHLGEEPWVFAWEEFKEAFEKENPNIKIQLEPITYGDKESVFITQSEARAAADIAHFSYRPIAAFIEKGYLLDLTPFVEREPGFKEKFLEKPLSISTRDGRIYALPDDFNPLALLYNTEMFKEAGLNPRIPPETWEEYIDCAKTLTRDTDGDGTVDQWGYGLIGAREEGLFMRFNPWFWGAGGDYLTADQKHSALNTPEALEGFKFYVELVTKYGVVPPGAVEMGCQDTRTQLAHRKVAMLVGTVWTPPIIDRLNPELESFRVLQMAPIPAGKVKATSCWISHRVISAGTKHPEEAWKVYRYIYSTENQIRWFRWMSMCSSRKDIRYSPMVWKDKFASVVAEQAPYVKFEPLIPEWPEIGDAMITAVQEAIAEIKSPEQALADAHAAVEQVLARKR